MSSLSAWPSLSEVSALGRGDALQCLPFRSLEMTTNCPEEDGWVAHLLAHDTRPVDANTVFLDVGCNTGADAVKYLDLWGRSPGIFQAWHEGLKEEGAIRAGSCQNNQSEWPQRVASSSNNPTVICVEPMSANVEVMRALHRRVLNSSNAFEIVHAAVSDHVGVADFPSGQVGTEDFGLDVASPVDPAGNSRQIETVKVDVTSAYRHSFRKLVSRMRPQQCVGFESASVFVPASVPASVQCFCLCLCLSPSLCFGSLCSNYNRPSCRLAVRTLSVTFLRQVDALMASRGLSRVDVLSVDTEGHDPLVLAGAAKALKTLRLLFFEVHQDLTGSPWSRTSLLSVAEGLDDYDLDCFWAGNNGKLQKITGCWTMQDESTHRPIPWANILCVRRGDEWHGALQKYVGAIV
ncbi:unnamed protein product [Symbiodinium natans]|uniref:Methyltransferase FkbM domain-containing protein n=1 Tax=Symbiodinium natans TaxID=878477 RepID=A0A812J4Z9_9DINO|nr:unnamed protein product [Symbiodinium natans]